MVDVAILPILCKEKHVGFKSKHSWNTKMFKPHQTFVYGGQRSLTQILCGMFSYIHYLQWQWPRCSRFPADLGHCTIHEAVRYELFYHFWSWTLALQEKQTVSTSMVPSWNLTCARHSTFWPWPRVLPHPMNRVVSASAMPGEMSVVSRCDEMRCNGWDGNFC